jgi:phosphoribosylamine-glycine ligase
VGLLQIQTRIDNINQDLQNAKNAVARAEAAQNLIDIKNYPYTVVVGQPIEVEEIVKTSKIQKVKETRYGGIKKDTDKTLPTNSGRKRKYIIGAINIDNLDLIHVDKPKINGDYIVEFLQKLEEAERNKIS